MVRKRQTGVSEPSKLAPESSSTPKMSSSSATVAGGRWSARTQWMFFAVASGACAAFNGVFAKLTTTGLTTTLATKIADLLNLSSSEGIVEVIVRGIFFALNLTFNGIMWTLFTTALARGTSTTQVSIMNTSTNFMFTAFLGYAIFGESLPPMWWAGAALLVAGNVIVGRKDESQEVPEQAGYVPVEQEEDGLARRKDDEDEDVIDLGGAVEGRER